MHKKDRYALPRTRIEASSNSSADGDKFLPEAEIRRLYHELEVHQIELRMQNEELQIAKEKAESVSTKYTALYDFSPSGYFTLNPQGIILELNLNAAKILHHERLYLTGQDFNKFVHPADRVIFDKFISNLFSSGIKQKVEIRMPGNHMVSYIYLEGIAIDNDNCIISAIDISARHKTENALENAYQKEKSVNEELRRINDVMDTFVYAAAHDLKAPISNLKLVTDLIKNTEDSELKLQLQLQYPKFIEALDMVISGLINVLTIEKNMGSVKRIVFQDIYNLIMHELDNEISKAAPEISANFSTCSSIMYIESYLLSIFRNVIGNSLKYKSDERKLTIDIHAKAEGKYTLLTFEDNGTGIDLELYGKDLFKPFKRFNSQSAGSGIGLHLIKNIVTKNGGRIELESKVNSGTIVRIYLVQYSI